MHPTPSVESDDDESSTTPQVGEAKAAIILVVNLELSLADSMQYITR